MRGTIIAGLLALALVMPAQSVAGSLPGTQADTSIPPSPKDAIRLPAVVVSGVQPGPGLWKVSRGDHVMWVLGTLTPLPKHMRWQSAQVEQAIAQSQELLEPPTAELKVQAGFFSKLALLPSVYRARKNPGGENLQQILPPPMFARWEILKQQYFGNDRGIERWRPILVAFKLYQKALDRAGLTDTSDVAHDVVKLARKHDIKRMPVTYQLVIEHPRDALQTIRQTNLHDVSCLNQTMDIVEHEMDSLTARANAWSTGDIATLRGFAVNGRRESCVVAVVNADFAQQLGLHDLPARMKSVWLSAAQDALARNTQTFAVLPMDQVLSSDGFLAALKAKGYTVQSPEEQDQ